MGIFSTKQTLYVVICILLAGCAGTQKPAPQSGNTKPPEIEHISWVMSGLGDAACSLGTLEVTLDAIANSVTNQRLVYSRKKADRQDCSGIFHRVIDEFRTRCPGPLYPPAVKRHTRALARWYVAKNQMHWIDQPLMQDSLIRVGAVMFFGQSDTRYMPSQLRTELMFQARKGIKHMGIVTKVKMKDGHVEQYWMLHGHGKEGKTMAGVTSTTYKNQAGEKKYNNQHRNYVSTRDGAMTPYGNWDEQWVGVAPVLDPQSLSSF